MKLDPYNNKRGHERWKVARELKGVSTENATWIIRYLDDMEMGFNTTKKKPLSFSRLNNLRQRLTFIVLHVESRFGKRITTVSAREAVVFLQDDEGWQYTNPKGREILLCTGLCEGI